MLDFIDFHAIGQWFWSVLGADDTHRKVMVSILCFLATSIISLLIGRWWGKLKALREWHRKSFLDRINVSMNIFADGYLKIRTVFERSLNDVFINPLAAGKVMAAAKKTTEKQPTLIFEKEDRWFLLNYVLNAVAEEFNAGLIKYDALYAERHPMENPRSPIKKMKYLLWLTCEQVGPDRIRKVRAMMIRKEKLLDLGEEEPKYEQEWHADRLETLKAAAELYKKEPDNFLTVELYV